MTNRNRTVVVIVAASAALIGWDIYVAAHPVPGDTISEILLAFATRNPFLPFAWGILSGHLFAPRKKRLLSGWGGLVAAGAAVAIVAAICPPVYPAIALLAGVPVGSFLWGQEVK